MNIKKAEGVASNASREEQLLIEITRMGLDNDLESQLSSAMKLLEIAPESPRAYLYLADVQSNLNQHTEARQSIANAIVLAPNMVSAHSALGNLYLFGEPKDLDKAEQHFQMVADLVPTEPNPYDHLGDVYRAQGQFEKALDAYTKAGMYSGEDGSPFQQRGHVNSFLGNFDAARADYEKAIDMARGSQAATFGVFRAFVQVHAGDPTAAIEELKIHSASIGEMDGPELIESQIFSLGSAVTIALHHGMVNEAEELIADWSVLMRLESEIVGTDAYNRIQEAIIAYNEGMLAVKKGEYDKAEEKASEIAGLVESESNPRKMEPVNEIKGAIALSQGNFEEAADYFKMGDHNNNIYIKFQLANALEGAGQSESAFRLYNDVANWNFITIGGILTRKEAIDKVKKMSEMGQI